MSPQTTGHQQGQKRSGGSVGKRFFIQFLSERGDCKHFRTCPSVNVFAQILPAYGEPQVEHDAKTRSSLEPSNYKQLPKIRMFFAESSIFFQDFTSGGRFLFSLNIFSLINIHILICVYLSPATLYRELL